MKKPLGPMTLTILAMLVSSAQAARAKARFVDIGNETITDNQTGLTWEKKTARVGISVIDIQCVDNLMSVR